MSDDRLRTALRELGDVPPPADLASGALARARRDRRRAGIALAAMVVLATAAAILVPATLRTRAEAPPAAPPSGVWVSSFRTMVGTAGGRRIESRSFVYDAASRSYRAVPGVAVLAGSPDGRQAVVRDTGPGGGGQAVVPFDRLTTGITEADWARRLPAGVWSWSPDGTRLLSGDASQRPTRAVVVDVRTRTVTRVPLQLGPLRVSAGAVAWGPGGRGFVGWTAPEGRAPAGSELVVFDETGRPIRRHALPAVGDVALLPNASVATSPEGRRALLIESYSIDANGIRGKSWVVDLETGATSYLSVPHQQWYDERHMIRIDASPQRPSSIVVADVDTRVVVSRSAIPALPGSLGITGVILARGVPPPGAVVL